MEGHFLLLIELLDKDKLLFCLVDLLTLPPCSHLLETRVMLPKDNTSIHYGVRLPSVWNSC